MAHCSKKKALRQIPAIVAATNAGLVSLTMTCRELFTCNGSPDIWVSYFWPMLPEVGLSGILCHDPRR
jgi:hypothetical protein